MTVRSYRDLDVWRLAMEIVVGVYALTERFPTQERYGLSSQLQRAAVSIPSNIAEGHARESTKEYLHFISIALGSLAELETQLLLVERLGLVNASQSSALLDKAASTGKMLRRLQQKLRGKIGSAQPPAPSPQPPVPISEPGFDGRL